MTRNSPSANLAGNRQLTTEATFERWYAEFRQEVHRSELE